MGCHEDEIDFVPRWFLLGRMAQDAAFAEKVKKHYKPEYQNY
jgi:hypothetical protein